MPTHIRFALRALTLAAWAVLIIAMTPYGSGFDPDCLTFARTVAVTGTIAFLVVHTRPDADELLRVGKALGRAEAQRELGAGNVAPIRPGLRIVGQRRPTE